MRGVLRFRVGRTPVAVQPWFWVTAVLLGLGSRSLLAFVLWPPVLFIAILLHEMGHALQDQVHYVPLKLRSGLVPAAQFGSRLGPMLFMGGLFLSVFSSSLLLVAWAGLILFAIAAVFTIITLPVEFNASKRAKELLVSENVLYQNEMTGVNKVLDAAALTYVAAAAQSISLVLYYAMILLGGGRRR